MATKKRYCGIVVIGTMAEIDALTHIYEAGTKFIATDKTIIKVADGVHATAALKTRQSTLIAALGVTTPLTAIAATYADLPAARASVNTLRSDTQARLAAIEAKGDAVIAAMITAGLMSAT